MTSGGDPVSAVLNGSDEPGAVLRAFRDSQSRARLEEAAQIGLAAKFASFHEVDDWTRAASLIDEVPGSEGEVLLGGDGCAYVSEFAVVEFAAATGRSTQSGRAFLGQCVELVHRLPSTWERVKTGQVDGWRARRVAEATMTLPREAAAWVDTHVASRVEKVGPRTLDRLVEEALARFDHEVADQLAACDGLGDSKAVRRARALGMLARGEVDFSNDDASADNVSAEPAIRVTPRQVELRLRVTEGETHATLHTLTGQPLGMVTLDHLRDWCGHANLTIRPVLDLTEEAVSAGRFPSEKVREQVIETTRKCVFPYWERPAEACDMDHVEEWDDQQQENGPPGQNQTSQTRTSNIGSLCRHHHRVKTHSAWTYIQLAPGEYLWTSPHGYRLHVAKNGTTDLARP